MSLIRVRKIATLDGKDKREGKDSIAADAKFKVGEKVKLSGSHPRFPNKVGVVTHVFPTGFVKVKVDGVEDIEIAERLISKAEDAAELRVGQRVRAKDPRWPGYQGRALGNGVYTVKKVDWDGTVKLDGFLDVWISPSSLVEANDACSKGVKG